MKNWQAQDIKSRVNFTNISLIIQKYGWWIRLTVYQLLMGYLMVILDSFVNLWLQSKLFMFSMFHSFVDCTFLIVYNDDLFTYKNVVSSITSNLCAIKYYKQFMSYQVLQAIYVLSSISSIYMVSSILNNEVESSISSSYVISFISSIYVVPSILSNYMASSISSIYIWYLAY